MVGSQWHAFRRTMPAMPIYSAVDDAGRHRNFVAVPRDELVEKTNEQK